MSDVPSGKIVPSRPDIVGVIPAAGQARRLQPLSCSKELLPVGQVKDPRSGRLRPKVAAEYLLDKFRHAGISKAVLVIREGKWDIPTHFGEGAGVGMSLAYVVISGSLGPPDSIDRAFPFVAGQRVAFGFPDILFEPGDAFSQLIRKQEQTGADIVLGLHPPEHPSLWDMVEDEESGIVRRIFMKPAATTLTFGWHCAVWTSAFTDFLHRFLRAEATKRDLHVLTDRAKDPGGDLAVGVVLQAALLEGLTMQSVRFPDSTCLDIGTPENLAKAVRLSRSG